MKWIWLANLVLSLLAVLAPMAHVLELPNKLSLDGELWLAVQQNLYRGWGPFLGGPVEIGALATSLFLALQRRRIGAESWPMLIASLGYAGHCPLGLDELSDALGNWSRPGRTALRDKLGGRDTGEQAAQALI